MKKLTAIALTLLTAGAAMANGLSREEVVAELVRARNAGELVAQNLENPDVFGRTAISAASTTSRSAVVAELQRARPAGELDGLNSESGVAIKATGSTTTRAQVLAELERARASGELDLLNSNNPSYAQLIALIPAKSAAQQLAGQPKSAQ